MHLEVLFVLVSMLMSRLPGNVTSTFIHVSKCWNLDLTYGAKVKYSIA